VKPTFEDGTDANFYVMASGSLLGTTTVGAERRMDTNIMTVTTPEDRLNCIRPPDVGPTTGVSRDPPGPNAGVRCLLAVLVPALYRVHAEGDRARDGASSTQEHMPN
jgi:hypothetical protein